MGRRAKKDSGIVLIVVLLVMLIFTVMMLGFYFVTTGEQKIAASDRDNTVAYYGAVGALEKMSSDLAAFFVSHVSPTPAQIDALTGSTYQPSIPNVVYPAGGYVITYASSGGILTSKPPGPIGGSGPLQGLQGIITPFTLTVTADGPNNTEVKMSRVVQEVAVPVFQFGIYSDSDLSFFAGPDFNFGGRVHTNGNLFLAEDGGTLTLGDRVTAYKDVIRQQLSNGLPTTPSYSTTAQLITTAGGCPGTSTSCRPLSRSEGSVVGGPGSAATTTPLSWTTLSLTTYAGNIRSGKTGAKKLNLALALAGAPPIAMIQRPALPPAPTEDPLGTVGAERFINQASLRILLSDLSTSITQLPGIDSTVAPFPLDDTLIHGAPYNLPAVDDCHPPLAQSQGTADNMSPAGTKLLGGFIKIEMQLNATPGTWKDVTKEILKLGISKDVSGTCVTNTSVLHLEQVTPGVVLDSTTVTDPTNFIPINMYDSREGEVRDNAGPSNLALNGVMNLAELDLLNLQKWFAGTLGTSGTQSLNRSGFIVYFSDRRGNLDAGGNETGEYGNEDMINPASAAGTPNGILDPPEDADGDGIFRTYGATPHPLGAVVPAWATFMTTVKPITRVSNTQAQINSVIFFRRALRLINGSLGNLPPLAQSNCTSVTAGGFTVAAENPVYILGDYNASVAQGFTDTAGQCHIPAAVIGDAVSMLSNSWSDANSFSSPTSPSGRAATDTWYRVAVISGKNLSFTLPTYTPAPKKDFGTDGGVHNFLRYIEDWSSANYNYNGSLVSFYFSRQATGVYKCCATVYYAPHRVESFDTDFQSIAKLPPGTPHFTDVNALSFQQAILSTQ